MRRMKLFVAAMIMMVLAFTSSGCAVVGAALGAGMAYGIYQATNN